VGQDNWQARLADLFDERVPGRTSGPDSDSCGIAFGQCLLGQRNGAGHIRVVGADDLKLVAEFPAPSPKPI